MDALPVREETGLPYASQRRATDRDGHEVPVMHACGHDMHVTRLLDDGLFDRAGTDVRLPPGRQRSQSQTGDLAVPELGLGLAGRARRARRASSAVLAVCP